MDIRIIIILILIIILLILLNHILNLNQRSESQQLKITKQYEVKCYNIKKINMLEWKGWHDSFEELSRVLRALVSYGNIFDRAVQLKKFYFREILRDTESLTSLRKWLEEAQALGIIIKKRDSRGVFYYEISREGLEKIVRFIGSAVDDLL